MMQLPPSSTLTDTLCPYPTSFRAPACPIRVAPDPLQRGRRGEGKRRRPCPAARKSVRGAVMRSLDDIFEDYDFLDGDDRYRLLIDLGRELEDRKSTRLNSSH